MRIKNFNIRIGDIYYTRWQEDQSILAVKLVEIEYSKIFGFKFKFITPHGNTIDSSVYSNFPKYKQYFLYKTIVDAIRDENVMTYDEFYNEFILQCNMLFSETFFYKWDGFGVRKVRAINGNFASAQLVEDKLEIIPEKEYYFTKERALEGHEVKIVTF